MKASEWKCSACGAVGKLSPEVKAIQVWMSRWRSSYMLLPEDGYHLCVSCGGKPIATLVEAACKANANTAQAGWWTRAFVIFDDGTRVQITQDTPEQRPTQKGASA